MFMKRFSWFALTKKYYFVNFSQLSTWLIHYFLSAPKISRSKKPFARLASIIFQRWRLLNCNIGSDSQLFNAGRTTKFNLLGVTRRAPVVNRYGLHFHFRLGSMVDRLSYASHIPTGYPWFRWWVSGRFRHSSPPFRHSPKDVVHNLKETYKAETHA